MKSTVIIAFSVFLLIGAGFYLSGRRKDPAPSPNGQVRGASGSQTKLLDSRYARYAFKIFPGPLGPKEQEALTGFELTTKEAADGSTLISLTPLKTGYQAQQYSVKPGYSLYFIETSMGDDPISANVDTSLGDDTAVLVDPQGYIAK